MVKGASAILRFTFTSKKETEIINKSLMPETKTTAKYRSKVKIIKDDENLLIFFEARDTNALRASINSYLSWLILLKDLCDFLESQNKI